VRDVAYDAEDILEEFVLRFAPSHGSGFIHYLRNSYRSIRKLSARHRLAVQVQSIKARVKAISERRNAFSLNRIDMPSTSSATVEKWHDPRLAALYLDEADVVGIENPKHLLVSWLVEGEEKLSTFIKTIERHRGEDFWRVQHITTITRIYESQGRRVSETLL
jgi:disease resistance protein RPM1